ncbi:MAG TPA: cytochrome c [Caulobacteraceae bacterium]|nr:cytochrome c [Caulobacteraceae bacterium]
MKFNPNWLVAGLVVAAAGTAIAQNAASVIQARQAHYKQIGAASKGIHDELGKPAPSATVIQGFAKQIDTLAPQIPTWFPAGSGPEAGVKTAAKPEIWSDAAGFSAVASAFATEAHHFDEVAEGGSIDAIRTEYTNLGKACFACHSKYRSKE